MTDFAVKSCKPCEGGVRPMTEAEIEAAVPRLPGWAYRDGWLTRTFDFKDYYQTMAFVNATAWISHAENHHPDLEVGYKTCRVSYMTHAIEGISENDFICAAKVNALLPPH